MHMHPPEACESDPRACRSCSHSCSPITLAIAVAVAVALALSSRFAANPAAPIKSARAPFAFSHTERVSQTGRDRASATARARVIVSCNEDFGHGSGSGSGTRLPPEEGASHKESQGEARQYSEPDTVRVQVAGRLGGGMYAVGVMAKHCRSGFRLRVDLGSRLVCVGGYMICMLGFRLRVDLGSRLGCVWGYMICMLGLKSVCGKT